MSRKIIPGKRLIPEFTYEEKRLPTHLPVAQYIRQSSEGQLKRNKQSSILQDKKLSERLTTMRFTEIIKIDTDQGKSGQMFKGGKFMEKKGIEYLNQLVATGAVGAVAAFSPSRLYRDLTRHYYTDFVTLLETHNVPLITFGKVYWADNRGDMDSLVQEFMAAANFIEQEIHGKLLLAKYQAIEDTLSYSGGSVPFGFAVKETEDRKYFIVYPPHAEKILFIYKRYRELNGNLPRLGRELQAQGFTFPAFDLELLRSLGVERAPYVTLKYKNGGYLCHTREALISILTNTAYIGWLVYGNVVFSTEAHEAIVSRDDFDYAFSRLSSTNLDGTENENKPKHVRSRYTSAQGLVETLLTCNGHPCYAMNGTYMVRELKGKWNSTTLSVPITTIDTAVATAILGVLSALDQRHKQGLSDDLYQQLEALSQEKRSEGVTLDTALKNVDAAIKGYELDKVSCRETGNRQGLDTANRELKNLYAAREDVLQKAAHAAKEQEDLQETLSLHQQVIADWYQMPFERQRRYASLIVASVTMEEVSPHVLKLVLTYKSPILCTLTGYVLREKCGLRTWTDEENGFIHTLYPSADRAVILQAIPNRTWQSICQQAIVLGIGRRTILNTSGIANNRAYADAQLLDSLQAGYPLFGKILHGVVVGGAWEPFDSAVLNTNISQHMLHRQIIEYSLNDKMD